MPWFELGQAAAAAGGGCSGGKVAVSRCYLYVCGGGAWSE